MAVKIGATRRKHEKHMNQQTYIYRIDAEDRIIEVSENWTTFHEGNSPAPLKDVIGCSVWDFIQDIEIHHLYKEIFQHLRKGKSARPIPFRCDSPDERRWLELRFQVLPNAHIELRSQIVRTEPRPPVKLLMQDTPRSQDFISICSMCKKIKVSENQWVEIEEGVVLLKLFEAESMPQLTHGLCADCYERTVAELNELPPPRQQCV